MNLLSSLLLAFATVSTSILAQESSPPNPKHHVNSASTLRKRGFDSILNGPYSSRQRLVDSASYHPLADGKNNHEYSPLAHGMGYTEDKHDLESRFPDTVLPHAESSFSAGSRYDNWNSQAGGRPAWDQGRQSHHIEEVQNQVYLEEIQKILNQDSNHLRREFLGQTIQKIINSHSAGTREGIDFKRAYECMGRFENNGKMTFALPTSVWRNGIDKLRVRFEMKVLKTSHRDISKSSIVEIGGTEDRMVQLRIDRQNSQFVLVMNRPGYEQRVRHIPIEFDTVLEVEFTFKVGNHIGASSRKALSVAIHPKGQPSTNDQTIRIVDDLGITDDYGRVIAGAEPRLRISNIERSYSDFTPIKYVRVERKAFVENDWEPVTSDAVEAFKECISGARYYQ